MKDQDKAKLIIKIVANYFEISEDDLRYGTKRMFYDPRKIVIRLIKNETRLSLARIGFYFNLNHSSITIALQTLDDLISHDSELLENINILEEKYLKNRIRFAHEIVQEKL